MASSFFVRSVARALRRTSKLAWLSIAALVATCAFAPAARAAENDFAATIDDRIEPTPEAPEPSAQSGIHVMADGFTGVHASSTTPGMVTFGASLGARRGVLEGHLAAEVGSQLLGGGELGASTLVGVGFPVTERLRFSALGELGLRHYDGVGSQLLGSPGVSLDTGFGGARIGVVYGFGSGSRFTCGAWLFARDDFTHTSKTVGWEGLFGDHETSIHRVGDVQLGAMIRLGFESGAL
jgi:hypothetical protein